MKMQNYSVLMSVYFKEAPEYLRQAIESIQAQTFPTDDFVLVCDGPLNDALDAAIAEKQQEMGSALNVVRLVKNGGLGNALNEGIKHCKNELVARMDSDDISVMDRCQKQVELFEKNPELDITSGALLEFVTSPDQITGGRTIPCNNNEIIHYSRKRCPFNHPCVMFKKARLSAQVDIRKNITCLKITIYGFGCCKTVVMRKIFRMCCFICGHQPICISAVVEQHMQKRCYGSTGGYIKVGGRVWWIFVREHCRMHWCA